jgi:regulator of sigma D
MKNLYFSIGFFHFYFAIIRPEKGKGKRALAKGRKAHHPGKDSSAIFVGNNKERRK